MVQEKGVGFFGLLIDYGLQELDSRGCQVWQHSTTFSKKIAPRLLYDCGALQGGQSGLDAWILSILRGTVHREHLNSSVGNMIPAHQKMW